MPIVIPMVMPIEYCDANIVVPIVMPIKYSDANSGTDSDANKI